MINIHPTAIVSKNAKIGENVEIGPFSIIHDDVEIGDDCQISSSVVIYNGARIGNRVKIFQGASVSNVPQDLKFNNCESYFYIGDDTVIREFVTLHRGTEATGFSRIGKNCLLMAYVHIAHDCVVGDNCIIANAVQLAGHVTLEDWVIVGGVTPVHQFCKVGQHSMIGGGFRIATDIPPYVLGGGYPLRFAGVNIIGLKRRGFVTEDIETIKKIYRIMYNSGLNFSQSRERIKNEYSENKYGKIILDFIGKGERSMLRR